MDSEKNKKQYKEITHTWNDVWEDKEVTVTYRFSRPTPADIRRMQSMASKNATSAAQQLLLSTVHADDKDRLLVDLEIYPALISTISSVIIRSCGLADLGNA